MKITPTRNILIAGNHSPKGVPVEVADKLARQLIADGVAVRYIEPPRVPVIETAEAPRAVETASPKRVRK